MAGLLTLLWSTSPRGTLVCGTHPIQPSSQPGTAANSASMAPDSSSTTRLGQGVGWRPSQDSCSPETLEEASHLSVCLERHRLIFGLTQGQKLVCAFYIITFQSGCLKYLIHKPGDGNPGVRPCWALIKDSETSAFSDPVSLLGFGYLVAY